MAIPFSPFLTPIGPGGGIVTSMRGANALRDEQMDARKKELLLPYAVPEMQANINNKNSITNRTNTLTPLEAAKMKLENQYYGPDIQSQINNRNAGTNKLNVMTPLEALELQQKNQMYIPNIQSVINNRNSLTNKNNTMTPLEAAKLQQENNNPMLTKSGTAGDIGALMFLSQHPEVQKLINQQTNGLNTPQTNNVSSNNPMQYPAQPTNMQMPQVPQVPGQPMPMPNGGINVSNLMQTLQNSIGSNMASKQAETALNTARANGYNWQQLTAEAKNSLTAQGYGMGIDPVKMKNYVSSGMSLQQIAAKEGLDPDNLPAPIYPPTTATKTRVQQVQQVSHELDYLSSVSSALIKPYASTYFGKSPKAIMDQISSDPIRQAEYGRYRAALALQTGVNNGRIQLEGGKPGVQILNSMKKSVLGGIDQADPIRMTPIAFDAMQKTLDEMIQKGSKIRVSTGMNPFQKTDEEISNTHEKTEPGVTKLVIGDDGKLKLAGAK